MLEIAKAEILQPGVRVSEYDGIRDIGIAGYLTGLGLNRPEGDKLRPTEVGEVIEFTGSTIFAKDRSLLVLKGMSRSNGVEAKVYEAPSTTFNPRIISAESIWEKSFGENPTKPAFETFGDPSTITAEFLGHSERDIMLQIMQMQKDDFNYELSVPLAEIAYSTNTITETLLFAGPVTRANIYGLTENQYNREYATPDNGFTGSYMLGAKIVAHSSRIPSDIVLFTGTIADNDGLFRLDMETINGTYENERIPKAMKTLAEWSVFTRTLQTMPFEHFPADILDPIKRGLSQDMNGYSIPSTYEGLRKKHGIDWPEICAGLPKDAVEIEQERLYDGFAHAEFAAKKKM